MYKAYGCIGILLLLLLFLLLSSSSSCLWNVQVVCVCVSARPFMCIRAIHGSRECLVTPTQRALQEPTKEKTLTASSVVCNYRVARVPRRRRQTYKRGRIYRHVLGTYKYIILYYILYLYSGSHSCADKHRTPSHLPHRYLSRILLRLLSRVLYINV